MMQGEQDEHRIFVGGIGDDDIDDEELTRAFSEHGPVFNVSVMPNRGFGFVSYYCKQHAENAIEDMDGKYLGHRPMLVEWAWGWPRDTPSSSEEEDDESEEDEYETVLNQTSYSNCTVYCGGLSGHITSELIEHTFSPFGEIEEISVFEERGYAFIRFNTKESATLAICTVNGTCINDEPVRCSWSHRPNVHVDQVVVSSSSSESSPESSRSASPVFDNFENILNQSTPNNCTVYCGWSGYLHEELLQTIFSPYGEIEEISVFDERGYAFIRIVGNSMGDSSSVYTEFSDYDFIRFATKISAALAICAVNDTEVNGLLFRCNWSHRPENRIPEMEAAASSSIPEASSILPSPPEAAAASSASLSDGPNGAAKAKGKNPDLLCKICMDEELGMVFLPCGHLTSCSKCAKKINLCPMCRKRITGRVRTFLS